MSAATAEAELLRVGGWWRRIIAGEAGVTESARPAGHRLEHAVEGQIAECVRSYFMSDFFDAHVGRNELLARRRVDTIVARSGHRGRADAQMDFAGAGGTHHVDEPAGRRPANDRVINHY